MRCYSSHCCDLSILEAIAISTGSQPQENKRFQGIPGGFGALNGVRERDRRPADHFSIQERGTKAVQEIPGLAEKIADRATLSTGTMLYSKSGKLRIVK
ncbi:hypothetical protein JJD41_15510 [Oxynema sp. CENA135]|uniref:hypothetical protein n=1 Tax=Oxynema sp. CENA135 TaxID=984206 RepID=UPI00190D7E27|nr:hypothetical protein [Oxynema sp. CENA135]MBK4731258.1 hypothetical protein [Oxynema sp. CENA135]